MDRDRQAPKPWPYPSHRTVPFSHRAPHHDNGCRILCQGCRPAYSAPTPQRQQEQGTRQTPPRYDRRAPPLGRLLAAGRPHPSQHYFGMGLTDEGGGSVVITQDHEHWRSCPILVIPFTPPWLPADLRSPLSIMELLAIAGRMEILSTLGLTGTIHLDSQGIIRELKHPHVLRRNSTGPAANPPPYVTLSPPHPVTLVTQSPGTRQTPPQRMGPQPMGHLPL